MSQSASIEIAGLGLITPLGHSAWETFAALLAGRTLTDRADALPADIAPLDLVRALGCVRIAQHTAADPAVELAEWAAREALTEAGADPATTPMILGSSKGAVHALTAAAQQFDTTRPIASSLRIRQMPDAALAVALGPHGYLAHHLMRRLGCPVAGQVVAACASSLMAVHQARAMLLGHWPGISPPREVLVVTAEAALLPMFVSSYRRLGVLAAMRPTAYRCLALDQQRSGFVLTETAAAVVLRRVQQSDRSGRAIRLLNTAVAAEACDMVRPPQQMRALDHAARQLLADPIDVLHPHATGTAGHDADELAVYASLLASQPNRPGVYACKGSLGHGLGAAGLTALVLACLIGRTGQLPAMPWLDAPIASPLLGSSGSQRQTLPPVHRQAIFAAGFAGHVAGAVIGR